MAASVNWGSFFEAKRPKPFVGVYTGLTRALGFWKFPYPVQA